MDNCARKSPATPTVYEGITLRAGACQTCGNRNYTATSEVIKGAAGVGICQSCGAKLIVVNKFFEILSVTLHRW